jgi:thiol-disulfide isomerase/thioredoxin
MFKRYRWWLVVLVLAGVLIGRYLYFLPKYTNGRVAPAFEAVLRDGSPFALQDLRGSYVLLDFWGSWCGPCRVQNPAWVAMYQEFSSQTFADGRGFHIVNVGVERDSARWLQAIAQDRLGWPHHIMDATSSLRFFNGGIAELYGIKQVPTSYLIDPQGQIIGVGMSPEMVQRLLRQRLSK